MAFGRLGSMGRGFGKLGGGGSASAFAWTSDLNFAAGTYSGNALVDLTNSRSTVGYADNVAGVWSSFLATVNRITDKGLLVEEARTNSIRNNSMQGAAAGNVARTPVTITALSRTASTVAVAAAAGHNNAVGDLVTVIGASVAAYNGTFAVSAISAGVSFSYITTGSATDSATGASYTAISFGTMPTNWGTQGTTFSSKGIVLTIVSVFQENGIDFIRFRANTNGANTSGSANFSGTTDTSATVTSGETWTGSLFMRLVSGSWSGFNSAGIRVQGPTSQSTITSMIGVPAGIIKRIQASITATGTASGDNHTSWFVAWNNAAPLDVTFDVGWPQFEKGSWASSPMRCAANAFVTRNADVLTLANQPVFTAVDTLWAITQPLAPNAYATDQVIAQIDDGDDNDRILLKRVSGAAHTMVVIGNSAVYDKTANSLINASVSEGVAYAVGAQNSVVSGVSLAAGTDATSAPSFSTLRIGGKSDGTLPYNGYIQRVAVSKNVALSAAQLAALPVPAADFVWVAEGDSITATGAPGHYPDLYYLNARRVNFLANTAVSGATMDAGGNSLTGRASTDDAYLTLAASLAAPKKILSVLIGRNGLVGYAGGTAVWLANFATYLDARRAAGWTVLVCTLLPSSDATFNTQRNIANTTIKTWVGTHADAVCDFGGDATMGPDAAGSDTNLYSDGTHPTLAGQVILTVPFTTSMNALVGL